MTAPRQARRAGRGNDLLRDDTVCLLAGVSGRKADRCEGALDADGLCALHAARALFIAERAQRHPARGAAVPA